MDGLLVIDKPGGPTSHDVVKQVKRICETKKVGHGGTLDPSATGVLLVGLGRATRLLEFLHRLPKTYRGVIRFGVTTSTEDADGEILEERPCSFSRLQLEEQASRFLGEIDQVPPMVSALKVGGESLYKLARRGVTLERKPRKVRIYRFSIEEFDEANWTANITVECSSGTYIRTLAADIGGNLGCGAHLSALRRTNIGSFSQTEAIGLETLSTASTGERARMVLGLAQAMRDFPSVVVDDETATQVKVGRPFTPRDPISRVGELPVISKPREGDIPAHEAGMSAGLPVAVLDRSGALLGVYRKTRQGLTPSAILAAQ